MALQQSGTLTSWFSGWRRNKAKRAHSASRKLHAKGRHRQSAVELLEVRQLLVSRVFLDFGNGYTRIPTSGVFAGVPLLTEDFTGAQLTAALGGAGTFTDIIGAFSGGAKRLTNLAGVINGLNPTLVSVDSFTLSRAVTEQIQRALEPFDIQVISSVDASTIFNDATIFGFPSANLATATANLNLNDTAGVPQYGVDDVYLFFGGLYAPNDAVLTPLNIPISAKFSVNVAGVASKPDRLDSGGIIDVNYWVDRVLGATGTGGSLNVALANAALYAIGWDYGLSEVENGIRGPYTHYVSSDTQLINQSNAMVEGGWTESFIDFFSPTGTSIPINASHAAYFNRYDMMQNGIDFQPLLRQGTLGNPPILGQLPFPLPPPGFPTFVPPDTTINTNPDVRVSLYDLLANDSDIGRNPDVQYVTGTGAFDRITIKKISGNRAQVTVEVFRNASFTQRIETNSYTFSLSKLIIPGRRDSGQAFRIIVEGCNSNDRVILDPAMGVQVVVHGGPDVERLNINGSGQENVRYTPDAPHVDPTVEHYIPEGLLREASGWMRITGAFGTTTVRVDNFNPMNASAVRLENFNSLRYNSPGYLDTTLDITVSNPGDWNIAGEIENPAFPFPFPFFPVPQAALTGNLQFTRLNSLVIDTTLGSSNDTVRFATDATLSTGLRSVNITMGAGNDSLSFDDSNKLDDIDYFLAPTEVDYGKGVTSNFSGYTYNGVQTLTVSGTQGFNEFVATPSKVTQYIINGDDPPVGSPEGDTLAIRRSGTTGATLTPNGLGNGIWSFTSGHKDIVFSSVEEVVFPPAVVAVTGASDTGKGKPLVKVYDAATNDLLYSFYAYPQSFRGGVRVAMADVNGDTIPDVIVSPGVGRSEVKVFDGAVLQAFIDGDEFVSDPSVALTDSFSPDGSSFKNGLYVAVGDVDGDGDNDIVTSRSRGETKVRVFENDGTGLFSRIATWRPYAKSVISGAQVAVADTDNDGLAEVITAPGAGTTATVKVFFGLDGTLIRQFNSFGSFRNGVSLAAGDATGDGRAEIFVGAGTGGQSRVRVFSRTGTLQKEFKAYTSGNINAPLRIAAVDPDGADRVLLFVGQGNDGETHTIRLFDPLTGKRVDQFVEQDPAFSGGVYLG